MPSTKFIIPSIARCKRPSPFVVDSEKMCSAKEGIMLLWHGAGSVLPFVNV